MMRFLLLCAIVTGILSAATPATLSAAPTTLSSLQQATKGKEKLTTDTIAVPEMECGMCESKLEKGVKGIEGVKSVSADAEANRVIVTYDRSKTSRSAIEGKIALLGYDAGTAATTPEAQAKLSACCRPSGH